MRVLHYSKFFSPVSQTFIYDLILQLDEIGVANTFAAGKLVNREERPYARALELPDSAPGLFVTGWKKVMHRTGLREYDRKAEERDSNRVHLKKLAFHLKPDIIHAHFGPHGYTALPVAKDLHIPLVVSFHGFDAFQLPHNPYWKHRLHTLFRGASRITVVSNLMKNHLCALGCPPGKIKVIHVGKKMDDYPFNPKRNNEIRNFISIGRLSAKKGHDDTISAFEILHERHPQLRLKIIGEGEQEEELKSMIATAGLESTVELLGSMDHRTAKKYLAEADAFILCSKQAPNGDQEGIPTVLMEAQALGVPCISTFHSGIPEVIPRENYWMLAEEGNPHDIALKIEGLIAQPKEVIYDAVLKGRVKTENEFCLEKETLKLKELYQSIL